MKKFFKFCGSLVLVLVVLGLILWGVGMAAVGAETMNEMAQKLTKGKVQMDLQGIRVNEDFMVKVEKILESNAIYDIDDANMFDNDYDVWKNDVPKTLIADGKITKLELELGGCMFELKDSGDSSYYVEYNGNGKSQAFAKGSELHVKVLNGNDWDIINWNTEGKENCLTLYAPMASILEEVEIELGAGQMKLDNLLVKDMEVDLGAGQILADGLQAEKLAVSVGAGEMVLDDALLTNVQVEVGAGNCEIKGNVTGDIEAECAVGNIALVLEGKESDFNYDIQCVTGNISIGDSEYAGLSQEQTINNNAPKTMDLECAMGNVEVEFK